MVYRLLLPLVASQAVLALTLFLLTTASVVESFMPPHPSYEDWVPVYEMRRQLNITYDYEPDHINPEYCRYLSEEKCREQDEGMGHAIAGRHGRRLNPSIGQFKVLVLLIRFSDHVDRVLPTRDYFESLFNGGIQPDVNKIGPIKDWFRYVSLGKYRVQFDVRDWYTTKETEAYYSKGASGLIGNDAIQEMFKPALDLVDASGINWNDGYISPW